MGLIVGVIVFTLLPHPEMRAIAISKNEIGNFIEYKVNVLSEND
jgi:hypothetical protein